MCTMQEPPFARDLSPNTLRQAVADVPGSLGIETKPTFLPLRVQYQSEKLQLGFGMHSLALPSGPHVPMSQFPAPGFGLSQFVTICHIPSDIQILSCRVPTPFAKAWFGPWIPWTRWLSRWRWRHQHLVACAKVHVQLPLGSWNYRKGRTGMAWNGRLAAGVMVSYLPTLEKKTSWQKRQILSVWYFIRIQSLWFQNVVVFHNAIHHQLH